MRRSLKKSSYSEMVANLRIAELLFKLRLLEREYEEHSRVEKQQSSFCFSLVLLSCVYTVCSLSPENLLSILWGWLYLLVGEIESKELFPCWQKWVLVSPCCSFSL